MNRAEFRNTKIGDNVLIGGNSKFKGQTATIIKTQGSVEKGRLIIIHNEVIGERRFYYGNLQPITHILKFLPENKSKEKLEIKEHTPEKDNKGASLMKKFNIPIQEKAYLYVPFNNQLKIHEGFIRMDCYMDSLCITKTENIKCSDESKVVYNNVLWLTERNDNLARAIFIQYEEAEIMILKEQIETKLNMIQTLKGGITI